MESRHEGKMRHFFKRGHWPAFKNFSGFWFCLRCDKGRFVRTLIGVGSHV